MFAVYRFDGRREKIAPSNTWKSFVYSLIHLNFFKNEFAGKNIPIR